MNAELTIATGQTSKISERFGRESYRVRSVPGGYKGDFVERWNRSVNGRIFDFSLIRWNGGTGGTTLTVREHNKTTVVHEWHTKG